MRFTMYSYSTLHKGKLFEVSRGNYLTSVSQFTVYNHKWMKVVVLIIYPIRPLVKYGKGLHIP